MEPEDVAGLNPAHLIELVERLREELAERDAALERRDAKIRELEEELAQYRRPAKTPENSSVPPSRGQKGNRAARRGHKHGPKRGHVGVSRTRSEPDVIVVCRPTTCDGCGGPLPGTGGRRIGQSQVVELPPVRPVVVEAHQYAVTCPGCGTRTVAAYPAGLEPRRTFGPELEALLGYFHERHPVSYERLVEICRDVFRLPIREGGIDHALRRLAGRARPTYQRIRETVRGSPTIGSDETTARVDGTTWWQWVFQTPEASYHVLVPSRAGTVIEAFLDGVTPAVWSSDLYAPQVGTPATSHQICLSHQGRDLTFASEADRGDERVWALALRHLFGRAVRLHHERDRVSPESFARRRVLIEKATDRLVFGPPLTPKSEARRLHKRDQTRRDSLYVFLYRDDVEPTNNSSERDLRPAVIHRKVIGGYRSAWGAEASAIFTSLLTTARKRGDNLLDALRAVAGSSPLPAFNAST